MKKTFLILIFLLGVSAVLCGCKKRGKINGANLVVGESSLYSKDEIEQAMQVVTKQFQKDYKGCTLTKLSYDESTSLSQAETWRDAYGTDEIIVLFSDFDVDSQGGDGSFNPDETYENWSWILTRKDKEDWTLRNCGYWIHINRIMIKCIISIGKKLRMYLHYGIYKISIKKVSLIS